MGGTADQSTLELLIFSIRQCASVAQPAEIFQSEIRALGLFDRPHAALKVAKHDGAQQSCNDNRAEPKDTIEQDAFCRGLCQGLTDSQARPRRLHTSPGRH